MLYIFKLWLKFYLCINVLKIVFKSTVCVLWYGRVYFENFVKIENLDLKINWDFRAQIEIRFSKKGCPWLKTTKYIFSKN